MALILRYNPNKIYDIYILVYTLGSPLDITKLLDLLITGNYALLAKRALMFTKT
jgi:hypothetical protein